jgi:hypothetical protein
MTDHSDSPPKYVATRFREWINYVTGSAIIRAQYVERVLNGICLMVGSQGVKFTQEDFLSGDSTRLKQTLGRIHRQLRDTELFDSSFIERLQDFVHRRNRIVHGLYADSFHSDDDFDIDSPIAQEYVSECEWLVAEGPELVEIGFGICRVLQEFVKPDHPEYEKILSLRTSFDEYFERGLGTFTAEVKSSINSK